MYGCQKYNTRLVQERGRNVQRNAERIVYDAVPHDLEPSNTENDADTLGQSCDQASAGLLGYSFQVIFQVNPSYVASETIGVFFSLKKFHFRGILYEAHHPHFTYCKTMVAFFFLFSDCSWFFHMKLSSASVDNSLFSP